MLLHDVSIRGKDEFMIGFEVFASFGCCFDETAFGRCSEEVFTSRLKAQGSATPQRHNSRLDNLKHCVVRCVCGKKGSIRVDLTEGELHCFQSCQLFLGLDLRTFPLRRQL